MKKLSIYILIIFCLEVNSQINTDSLYKSIKESDLFYPPKPFKSYRLLNTFSHFVKKDSTEAYFVYFDSNNQLSSFLDLCILYEKYDYQKRLLKLIGYSRDGRYSFYDFSPIVENEYFEDSTIEKLFDSNYSLSNKKSEIFNKEKQLVEIINEWDSNYTRVTIDYKNKNERIKSKFDINGNNLPLEKSVYHIWQKIDSTNEVIEQNFYNKDMILVNGNHYYDEYNKADCNYSKFIVKKENNKKVYYFYNDKDELECEFDGFFFTITKIE